MLTVAAVFTLLAALSGRSPQTETSAPEPRPVRTATVEEREAGVPITLTGRIEAEDEVALAFRIRAACLRTTESSVIGSRLDKWSRGWNCRTSATPCGLRKPISLLPKVS